MYVVKSPLSRGAVELEQGDILADFLLPSLPGANSIFRRQPESVSSQPIPLSHDLAATQLEHLEIASPVTRGTVLIVSNTCDMSGGGAITVVPVLALALDSANASSEKQWKEIQRRATSGNWSKSFYLGPLLRVGLARSHALLAELVTLQPAYVDRLLQHGGARRIVGLNADAATHLRWALGYFFGRNSRELNDWHSDDDLLLRRDALASVPAAKRDEAWNRDTNDVIAELAKRGLEPVASRSA